MLGTVQLYDDIELGITSTRVRPLPPRLPELWHIPDEWYIAAFRCLPKAMALVNHTTGKVLCMSDLFKNQVDSFLPAAICCLEHARQCKGVLDGREALELSNVKVALKGGEEHSPGEVVLFRAWLWCFSMQQCPQLLAV